jgi:putative sterol carrier protein
MTSATLEESLLALASGRPLGATIAMKLTDGETWYVKSVEGDAQVGTAELLDVKATFTLSTADLQAMLAKTLNPTQAFMSGKMQIQGDMGVAMKLAQLMA